MNEKNPPYILIVIDEENTRRNQNATQAGRLLPGEPVGHVTAWLKGLNMPGGGVVGGRVYSAVVTAVIKVTTGTAPWMTTATRRRGGRKGGVIHT